MVQELKPIGKELTFKVMARFTTVTEIILKDNITDHKNTDKVVIFGTMLNTKEDLRKML